VAFGVWGLGFGVWGLEFGVWGSGFKVWGLRFGVYQLLDGRAGRDLRIPVLEKRPVPCHDLLGG
jgi:hypothetical protein